MTPARVQLRRTRGWRKPDGCVVVARPGRFGNPFCVGDPGPDGTRITSRAETVQLFRRWLTDDRPETHPERHARIRADLRELRGHLLACWCPLAEPCHADVLLEIANT